MCVCACMHELCVYAQASATSCRSLACQLLGVSHPFLVHACIVLQARNKQVAFVWGLPVGLIDVLGCCVPWHPQVVAASWCRPWVQATCAEL